MLKNHDTHEEFERVAREYLREQVGIPCEWRVVSDAFGGRTDVICFPGTAMEVFASLTASQITIGIGNEAEDFEDFGRKLTREELAEEAFARFKSLLLTRMREASE